MKSTTGKAKRFLAGLLCMGMLVTSLPAAALATELTSGIDPGADASASEETTSVTAQEEGSTGDAAEEADEGDAAVTAADTTDVYIATYVGQVPTELADADDVTADLFDTAWETVSVTVDSTNYYVEVVPEGTVYFIDSVVGNNSNSTGAMEDVTSTEPYAAVAALLGDQLLNEKSDQYKTSDTTWGLVDTDAVGKSWTSTTDKMATGIYGANNTTGETLTYSLTLSAGTYTLTSGHREWWSNTRGMTAVVADADGSTLASSTISLSGSSGDIINELSFTVTEEQVITYTLTATNAQAPVISWLGVVRTGDVETTDPGEDDDDEEEDVPTEPDLSAYNFCDPLEDNNGLTLAASTISAEITGCGVVIDNEVQWNNNSDYHAIVNDASVFQNGSFTLMFDIRQDAPSGDTNITDQRSAFTIGNSTNCIHVLTWSGKFGYGSSSSGISGNSVYSDAVTLTVTTE